MCYIDYNANSSCKSGQPQLLPPCVLQLNEENWARQRVLNFISGKICFLTITKGWDLKQASRRWILISLPMVSPPHSCTSTPMAAGRDHPTGYKALGLHRSTPAPLFAPSSLGFPSRSSMRDAGDVFPVYSWYLHHCSLPACISRVTASTAVQLPPLSMALLSKLLH